MKKAAKIPVHYSTDLWADLGFQAAEAQDLRIRSHLMISLREFVREKKLTQAQAAKLLGVTQPRVSDLMKGKINLFSATNLIKLLGKAGLQVDVQVRAAA
jgi:predicted XRE-type DNA-binding protein